MLVFDKIGPKERTARIRTIFKSFRENPKQAAWYISLLKAKKITFDEVWRDIQDGISQRKARDVLIAANPEISGQLVARLQSGEINEDQLIIQLEAFDVEKRMEVLRGKTWKQEHQRATNYRPSHCWSCWGRLNTDRNWLCKKCGGMVCLADGKCLCETAWDRHLIYQPGK